MTMAQSKARGSRQKPKHDRKPRAPRAPSVSDTFHAPRTPRKRRQGAGRRKPAELDTIVPYDSLAGLSPLTDPPSPLPEAYAPNVTPGHPAPDTTRADDTPRHNCSVVDTELKEARAHVAELTMRIQDRAEADDVDVELNDQLQSLTAEVWTLKRRLEETTTELLTATTDLALLREWTTFKSEDNTALLNLFDDINDKISEAAYQFVDMLDIRYDDTVQAGSFGVCLDDPDNTELGQRTMHKFLQHCVTTSMRTRYALRQVIRAIYHRALAKHVFHQFTPGLDSSLNKFLTDICSHLSREEMQTTSGMWRALAYSNAKRHRARTTEEDAEKLASFVVDTMDAIARKLLIGFPESIEKVPRSLERLRIDLVETHELATRWQDLARGTHISTDYTPFLSQPGVAFSDDEMLREGPASSETSSPSAPATVLLSVKMGLKAWSTERGESRTRICRVVRKAGVV